MKTYFSFIILTCLVFVSCNKIDQRVAQLQKSPAQKQDSITDSTVVRTLKEYFSNGRIKTETSAKGKLRHGLTKNYDREGHLISQVNYVNNVREGMATNFYLSGKVNSTLVYKNGIKEGDEIWYYESGKPYRITPYIKGKANGIQKYLYEDGKIKATVPMKNGFAGTGLKEYKSDGTLITGYPQLVLKQKDFIATANKVVLNIEITDTDPYAKVVYYRGTLKEGKYLSADLMEMVKRNGAAQIDFNLPPGSAVNQTVSVVAKYTTKFGNPLVLSKSYTVHAINNN